MNNAYKTKDLLGTIFNSKYRTGKLISMSQKFRYEILEKDILGQAHI